MVNHLRVAGLWFFVVAVVVAGGAAGAQAAPAHGMAKADAAKSNAMKADSKDSGSSLKGKLLGRHMLSLQWILYDDVPYGTANVSEKDGVMKIHGEQKGKGGDYLKIDGVVSDVKPASFAFDGKIATKVKHINNGAECVREGKMTFIATGKRKYWRMRERANPCDNVTDYVDVYFR